jgi:hypothetical protein
VDDACSSGRGRLMRRKQSEQSWPRPATAGTRAGRSCEMWAAACCGQRRSTQAAAAAPSAGRRRRQLQPVRGGNGGCHRDWRRRFSRPVSTCGSVGGDRFDGVARAQWYMCTSRVGGEVQRTHGCWMS